MWSYLDKDELASFRLYGCSHDPNMTPICWDCFEVMLDCVSALKLALPLAAAHAQDKDGYRAVRTARKALQSIERKGYE